MENPIRSMLDYWGRKGRPIQALVLTFGLASMAQAQLNINGLPFITNYHGESFPGDPQSWAVVLDSRGILYVGNAVGLLEFDGRSWRTVAMPNRSTVRSLAVDANDRVWIGAIGEIGYLSKDSGDALEYRSLLAEIPESERAFEYVWRTHVVGDAVTFVTDGGLFVYRQGRMAVVKAPGKLQNTFRVGDELFVSGSQIGLAKLVGERLDPLPNSTRFIGDRIYAILPYQGATKLVFSRNSGVFILDASAPGEKALRKDAKFDEIEKVLAGGLIYCGVRLASGVLALGTVKNGLQLFDQDGRLLHQINKARGLRSDTILTILVDPRDNLWLGTSNGVAYLETGAPFGVIDERQGVAGHGYAACLVPDARARGGERLYVGSVGGVYFRDVGDGGGRFTPVPNTSDALALQLAHGVLLCAQSSGLVEIRDRNARSVLDGKIVWTFERIPGRPDLLLAGTIEGLSLIEWRDGGWQHAGSIAGFAQSSRFVTQDEDGAIWVAHRNKGIFRVTVDLAARRATEVRRYDSAHGLPSDLENSVFRLFNRAVFATVGGLHRFNRAKDRFEPDPVFADLPWQQKAVETAIADAKGNVWFRGPGQMGVLLRRDDGSYLLAGAALRRLRMMRVPVIAPLHEGQVIFGTSEGFVDYAAALAEERKVPFPTLLRRIECPTTGRTFKTPATEAGGRGRPVEAPETHVPPELNQLRFVFTAAFHDGASAAEFCCILDGLDSAWSAWSTVNERTYHALGGGHYVFRVKARDIYGIEAEEATFRFAVLTPIYRQGWAIALYVLAAGSLLLGGVKLYTHRLSREKTRLELLVFERTEELREATLRDPLTGLRNRRFLTEVVEPDAQSFFSHRRHLLQAPDRRGSDPQGVVFGLYMIDLDHFKVVNDRHGHAAGDAVLKAVSDLLRQSTRLDDFVIRWGGEEFLIVLKRTGPEYAEKFAGLIRERVESMPFSLGSEGGEKAHLTCSVGYVTMPFYPDAPELVTLDQSLMLADLGLTYAKEHGRNQVIKVQAGPTQPVGEEIPLLLGNVSAAIERGFVVLNKGR